MHLLIALHFFCRNIIQHFLKRVIIVVLVKCFMLLGSRFIIEFQELVHAHCRHINVTKNCREHQTMRVYFDKEFL